MQNTTVQSAPSNTEVITNKNRQAERPAEKSLSARVAESFPYPGLKGITVGGKEYHHWSYFDLTTLYGVICEKGPGVDGTIIAYEFEVVYAKKGQPNFICYVERSKEGSFTGNPSGINVGRIGPTQGPVIRLIHDQDPIASLTFAEITPFNRKWSQNHYEKILSYFAR